MSTHVPDMSIAPGGIHSLGNTAFTGAPIQQQGFVTVAPQIAPRTGAPQRKQLGLLPAVVGALFPLIVRDQPRGRVKPEDVSRARAEVRRAERDRVASEALWMQSATRDATGQGDKDALLAARDAVDRVAMHKRKLAELETAAMHKATQVRLSRVVDPSEVPDALANPDAATYYVCMHDGCRNERWASEAEMRRAHPTLTEMQRAQQAHVYALLSDAPMDPLDPEGPTVGYVAPIGRDGSTVERAIQNADAVSHADERDERIAMLEAKLAELSEMVANVGKKGRSS